ncbi:MAG: GNAT family N-acetyltransferase [Deltaproteobacteria bacterium]|nr:GNAT family N-acetyltransferase [Candidatus Zymogenaceae bacterium]
MADLSPKSKNPPEGITVRHDVRPGDLGSLIGLHGVLYGRQYGYDHTFEPYVARPMADFILSESGRQRIWIVETGHEIAGCLAVVEASDEEAQLRWFLLSPQIRGRGVGRYLFEDALIFCREAGYKRAFLLTVDLHTEAAALYLSAGFVLTEEHPAELWGAVRTEQRYDIRL